MLVGPARVVGRRAMVVVEGGRDGGAGRASLGSNAPELSSVGLDLREDGSVRIRQSRPQACFLCETYALHFYLDLKLLIYRH